MKRHLLLLFLYDKSTSCFHLWKLWVMNIDAFERGLDALYAQDYKGAAREFDDALNTEDGKESQSDQYGRFSSYLGLAKVLNGDDSGLLTCRDAASSETTYGDVFLNVACAEWHSNNRKRAIDAIHKGVEIDPGHQQLNKAVSMLDSRKSNPINFLDRNHFLNKALGRLLRKKPVVITVNTLLS